MTHYGPKRHMSRPGKVDPTAATSFWVKFALGSLPRSHSSRTPRRSTIIQDLTNLSCSKRKDMSTPPSHMACRYTHAPAPPLMDIHTPTLSCQGSHRRRQTHRQTCTSHARRHAHTETSSCQTGNTSGSHTCARWAGTSEAHKNSLRSLTHQ